MKKIIALVAASVLASAAVFAESTFHIGAYFPISPLTASDDDNDMDFFSSGAGGAFDYTHVADGGFTFKVGLGLAYVSSSDVKSVVTGDDLGGIDFDLGFGFGGSFIHDERMTLSLTGDFGFRIQDLHETASYKDSMWDVDISTNIFTFLFYIGPEIEYTFRFNDHIGLFANFGIFYNVGMSIYSIDCDNTLAKTLGDFSGTYVTKGFTFQPKIGGAFTL